jgi:hypothetical protein
MRPGIWIGGGTLAASGSSAAAAEHAQVDRARLLGVVV